MMRRARVVALAALPLAGAAGAHPHSYVDQQVQLSLGLDAVAATVVIVPSAEEGAAILAHLDRDADGAVSPGEAAGFGAAVLEGTRLEVDGQAVELSDPVVEVAEAETIRSGTGAISVTTAAPVDLAPDKAHQVVFEVTYGELSHEWFVQPFYRPELIEAFGLPALERSPEGQRVTIGLATG